MSRYIETEKVKTNEKTREIVASIAKDLNRVFISEDSSKWRKTYYKNRNSQNNKKNEMEIERSVFISFDKSRRYTYEKLNKREGKTWRKYEKNDEIQDLDLEKMRSLRCRKDFVLMTKIRMGRGGDGSSFFRNINVVQGLELWDNFLDAQEHSNLIDRIEKWNIKGEEMKLVGKTYSAPRKWMRGKGRKTIQFGCCYNYAVDKKGRQPGILIDEPVELMPPILNDLCDRLVRWHMVPAEIKPDSAIVNIYEEGDCIPPHIDNKQFCRPFVTISLVSNAYIAFGHKIKAKGPGEFMAPMNIMLKTGSCLILKGNGADIAEHCIPAVKDRRISITLRKMGIEYSEKIKEAIRNGYYGWQSVHDSEVNI